MWMRDEQLDMLAELLSQNGYYTTPQSSSKAQVNFPQATEADKEYSLMEILSSTHEEAKSSLPCAMAPTATQIE